MNTVNDGLRVEQVHVWRGDSHVLRGVSVHVLAGEVVHIAGPNGAGKSTLLRVMTGLLRPEQGGVSWHGEPILRTRRDFQTQLAYAAHEPALKGDLTALENLRFSVGLRRRLTVEDYRSYLQRVGVAACADLPARVLSAGQRRRVALARILALDASLWLLDEPYTNLDAAGALLLSGLLRTHVQSGGLAVVVAHHDLDLGACQRRLELNA